MRSEGVKARPRAGAMHSMISYILHSPSHGPTAQGNHWLIWRSSPEQQDGVLSTLRGSGPEKSSSDKGFRGFLQPRRLPGEVLLETELLFMPPRLQTGHGCLLCTCAPAVAAKACADILLPFHLNNRFLNNGSESNPMLRHFHFNVNEFLTCK